MTNEFNNLAFTKLLENLATQLVTIMEYNNHLLMENLRLMRENEQLRMRGK